MECEKSKLRKLKKKKRWWKNEESRKLNRKFQLDTGGVTLEKTSKVKRSVRDQATTRKSCKKVNTKKERYIQLRKRLISGSSFGNRKEVETLRHHGWEY